MNSLTKMLAVVLAVCVLEPAAAQPTSPDDPTRQPAASAAQPANRNTTEDALRRDAVFGPVPTDAPGIVEIRQHTPSGVWSIELENGVTVNLRPMEGVKLVTFNAIVVTDDPFTTRDAAMARAFAATLEQPAIGGFPWEVVAKSLSGLGVRPEGTPLDDGISVLVQSRAESAAEGLRLFAAMLEMPAVDNRMYQRWRRVTLRQLEAADTRPQAVLNREFRAAINAGAISPRIPPASADVAVITKPTLEQWATQFLANARVEIGIAGDFEIESMIEQCRLVLSTQQSRPPMTPRPRITSITEPVDIALAVESEQIRDLVVTGVTLDATTLNFTDRVTLGALSSLYRERLEAAFDASPVVFGVSAGAIVEDVAPGSGAFVAYIPVARGETESVAARADAIRKQLAERPPSADELAPVLKLLANDAERRTSAHQFWATRVLSQMTRASRDLDRYVNEPEYIATLTPERLAAAAERIFAEGLPLRITVETFGAPTNIVPTPPPSDAFDSTPPEPEADPSKGPNPPPPSQ